MIIRKTFPFLILLLLSMSLTSQSVDIDGFKILKASTSVDVSLIASDTDRVEVEMIKGDFKSLIVKNDGDRLVIKFKKKKFGFGTSKGKANVDVYFIDIDGIDVSAGAHVGSEGLIKADDFMIAASSGSTCTMNLTSDDTTVEVSSGASVRLKGIGNHLVADVSSDASFKADQYESESVDVEASSGASAKVWATREITAEASSGASVKYKGDPKKENIKEGKYSGGTVKKSN